MQKEHDFPREQQRYHVDTHLITVLAEDDELIINSLELANGQHQAAQHLIGPHVQYVRVDVPGDGSCQMSSFRLGMVAAHMLAELRTMHQQGQLTPAMVAELVMEKYLEAVRSTYPHQAQPSGSSSKSSVLPQLNGTMYDRDNLELRHMIVKYWRSEFDEFKKDLKRDVQNIIWQMLEAEGLVSSDAAHMLHDATALDMSEEEEEDWGDDEEYEVDEDEVDEPEELHYVPVPDEDFIMNALYHPASWHTFIGKSKTPQNRSGQAPRIMAFGVDPAELLKMDVPMGIAQDSAFAQALRDFVASYAARGCVEEGFIPLGSVVVPALKEISEDLVYAYMNEFEVNCHLWGTESSLKALSDDTNTKVIIHTFDGTQRIARQPKFEDPEPIVPFQNGPANLYEAGVQNHFQVLIGPFEQGFLREALEADRSSQDHWQDEASEELSSEDDDVPVLQIPPGYNAPDTKSQQDAQYHKGLWFLHQLASVLYKDFADDVYAEVLQRLFRALAVTQLMDEALDKDTAASIIRAYEQDQQVQKEKALAEDRNVQPPLVPMVGYMGELFAYHIPLQEILRLVPHVRNYVAFHRKKSSWKKLEAGSRVETLKSIAALLNDWADTYHQPSLHRSSSIAEFLTRPSSLVPGTWEGLRMRALLTIDPGDLVGGEPEPYEAWDAFNAHLPGYVRAHLLNKHLGGPGTSDNLAFLSSQDNLRMSDLAEEDVKRLVLEENRIVFYTVAMPVGMDEIHQGATIDKTLTDAMVREVQMFASAVTPITGDDGVCSFELDEDILRKKLQRKLPGVFAHPDGGITLKATPPDMETIGKLQAHWTRRMKQTGSSSKQERLPTLWDQRIRQIERKAHKALLQTDDANERAAIIEDAVARLRQQGVDEDTLSELTMRLAARKREVTMVQKAGKRKAESDLMKQPKRRKLAHTLLAKSGITVDDKQLEEIATLGKASFAKYVELRKFGSSHGGAMRNCKRRKGGQYYEEAKEGAQNKKNQAGIYQFLKKKEDDKQ